MYLRTYISDFDRGERNYHYQDGRGNGLDVTGTDADFPAQRDEHVVSSLTQTICTYDAMTGMCEITQNCNTLVFWCCLLFLCLSPWRKMHSRSQVIFLIFLLAFGNRPERA